MNHTLKLPVGIENFEELRTEGFYYVDKTRMITELLNDRNKVTLFTRPRRFGKSLNMSMLKHFFSYDCDPALFDGLAIAEERELCEKYMGKYPVISVSLKSVEAPEYDYAEAEMCTVIGNEALRFRFLLDSDRLSEEEKKQYQKLIHIDDGDQRMFSISRDTLTASLRTLSGLLYRHYGQKAVLLIDEYDVPLDKAQQYGYYNEMVSLIRGMFGQAFKTNDNIFIAVLTGCLRIAKESIFTGLNNFRVMSVTNVRFNEHFGFSDNEVKTMLAYYGLEDKYGVTKEWYDGYRFGNADVYCPWDVINHVAQLRFEPDALPKAYWINSSGNAILRALVKQADTKTMRELEQLVNGMPVVKKIHEELTYNEVYDSTDNLWSVLFTTGYLTGRRETAPDTYELVIPNREIRMIFTDQILSWFYEEAGKDTHTFSAFCEAFEHGDTAEAERLFTAYLKKTISVRDTATADGLKENFYHGLLLGLLDRQGKWFIRSNVESGDGYSDILIETDSDTGIVIEVKYAGKGSLEAACKEALAQIEEKNYAQQLIDDEMKTVLKYGIACRRKTCMVRMAPQ